MTTPSRSWEAAIRRVLEEAQEPLHYKEIAHRIITRNLRPATATPENTVSYTLTRVMLPNGIVRRVGPGIYQLAGQREPQSQDEIRQAQQEGDLSQIAAYGLYWDRSKVNWNPGQGQKKQLLGISDGGSRSVDFSSQSGVYILYNRLVPMYVGRTDSRALFTRLESHTEGARRTARWDQFSWFGFRKVNEESATLLDESENFSTSMLITVLEAVMIEALIPPLNDKGGDLLGTMYRQVEDSALVERRQDEFRQMVGDAISRR